VEEEEDQTGDHRMRTEDDEQRKEDLIMEAPEEDADYETLRAESPFETGSLLVGLPGPYVSHQRPE
jgi:hypothetical protein